MLLICRGIDLHLSGVMVNLHFYLEDIMNKIISLSLLVLNSTAAFAGGNALWPPIFVAF